MNLLITAKDIHVEYTGRDVLDIGDWNCALMTVSGW